MSVADVLGEAAERYGLDAYYALFSGGHDSLSATHVASQHPLFRGVIHIDTGTGIEETRDFVEETRHREGWQLHVGKPATTYEMLLVKMGFPGAPQHSLMYQMLKQRPLRQILKTLRGGTKLRIGLITGVRTQESDRRMGYVDAMRKDSEGIWVNPIHDWGALEVNQYVTAQHLRRSEVRDRLHLSGECCCGSFATAEEYKEIDYWYPKQGARIRAWEQLVRTVNELGLNNIAATRCRWGHGNGKRVADEQTEMFPLCQFCLGKATP